MKERYPGERADLLALLTMPGDALRPPVRKSEEKDWGERHAPLADRIKRILAAMPEEERSKPRSISFFVERLKGRTPGKKAHAGQVGAALRSLGFTYCRDWHNGRENGFSALWTPPH